MLGQSRKFKFIPVFEQVDYLISTNVAKQMPHSQSLPTGFSDPDAVHLRLYSLVLQFGTELTTAADDILKHVGRVMHCFVTKRGYDVFGSQIASDSYYSMLPRKDVLMNLLEKADVGFHQKLLAYLMKDCNYIRG